MKGYLDKMLDWRTAEVVNQYDELPFWSAPFGSLLLDNFPLGRYGRYLDVGCGTGFPLIDIAQRLGVECEAFGVDPWHEAHLRAQKKIDTIGLSNVSLLERDASDLPFEDSSVDLITSNLGINNFTDPPAVLDECYRVLKPGAPLCVTSNLTGTFGEFYTIFEATLNDLHLWEKYGEAFENHVNHRGTVSSMEELLDSAGFGINKRIESSFSLRYLDGSAFLNHSVIAVGFIDPWRNMFDDGDRNFFFNRFEEDLNRYSEEKGELNVSIPMVYFECRKINSTFHIQH